jgi:hypothetical protein
VTPASPATSPTFIGFLLSDDDERAA